MDSNGNRVICKDGRVFHACEVCRKRRSRCDGVKPKCTSCQRRGLECEYRAMRKRGRHGKKAVDEDDADTGSTDNTAVAMAAAAWSLASPPLAPSAGAGAPMSAAAGPSFSLLDSLPRFFSLPPEMSIAGTQQPASVAAAPMDSMMSVMARLPHAMGVQGPGSMGGAGGLPGSGAMGGVAELSGPGSMGSTAHGILASVLSPAEGLQASSVTSAFLGNMDRQLQYLPHHYRSRAASSFLGSPSPNSTFSQHTQPPLAFRSMSASSAHVFDSSVAMPGSFSAIASPIGLESVLGSPSLNMPFSPPGPPQQTRFTGPQFTDQQFTGQQFTGQQNPSAAAAAAAAAAAVAAFQFSPTTTSATHALPNAGDRQPQPVAAFLHSTPAPVSVQPSSATQPAARPMTAGPMMSGPVAARPMTTGPMMSPPIPDRPASTLRRRARKSSHEARAAASPMATNSSNNNSRPRTKDNSRRQGGDWSRTILEEDEVLDGLREDGADHFGRPLFDVSTYALPSAADLDEHMNGMFEYFYMGGQTLHAPTFRRQVAHGHVSPVLVYAIMAVASRYSRRPSLHSLNGMAFLNGDRHAATACGLASILLNHGDLGTVDTIHAMLFLSVYFMGQGNMLKSRMYLVKAVCTARTMGFQNMDATFVPSNPMVAFSGTYDRRPSPQAACECPRTPAELVELERKRRIWWFLVFVDYFTANVMHVPLEIPPDSYCVRLPCSDEEWMSDTLTRDGDGDAQGPGGVHRTGLALEPNHAPRDLGFGDRLASAQQSVEYLRLNGFHDCRPPWLYRPGAFYLERLMIEFCDHLRRLNNLRSLAIGSFFHTEPVFVDENYPYLKRRRQSMSWAERLDKVKSAWSWLHLQLNKWLDSILLRFSEVVHRVTPDRYNRQYRHQYYYYLLAAHSTIIMSHGVVLQLYSDFTRYISLQQSTEHPQASALDPGHMRTHTPMPHLAHPGLGPAAHASVHVSGAPAHAWTSPPIAFAQPGVALSEGLSEFALGTLGSTMAPLISYAQNMASGSSAADSSIYGSVIGSPVSGHHSASNGSRSQSIAHPYIDDMPADFDVDPAVRSFHGSHTPSLTMAGAGAACVQRDLADMAVIAWDGCVSTAEQLASILRGKHPKFVLLGGSDIDAFHEQVRSGDSAILSAPGSAFNAPGTGPGADNPILSDPDFYMRLQPSTAWWMFLVAQVQVGHIKRLLKESEGNFKVSARRKAHQAKLAAAAATAANGKSPPADASMVFQPAESAAMQVDQATEAEILGMPNRMHKASDQMRPLSTSVNNSAVMLATAVHLSNSAPQPPTKQAMENRAEIKTRGARLVRAYENLSCMVKVLEGMQQYWQCMDYVSVIQDILKGSEHPLH
ncbi:hypothetical protein GGF49_005473 [Coemansia sp. RSA 1853]|nr:hypothetical protein GGF49_005473 [Coemansia sp. RSA 1853]